jgi:hypothetical protein
MAMSQKRGRSLNNFCIKAVLHSFITSVGSSESPLADIMLQVSL